MKRATSTPAANSPTPPTASASHRLSKPSRYGSSGTSRTDREADERRAAAVHGLGSSSGHDAELLLRVHPQRLLRVAP